MTLFASLGGDPLSLEEFFEGYDESRRIFDRLLEAAAGLGPTDVRVTKSQVAFVHEKPFARAWIPDKYLHGKHAPLVLTLAFRFRDASPRWKEIAEVTPGNFVHHLELWSESDIDDQVKGWLQAASERSAKD